MAKSFIFIFVCTVSLFAVAFGDVATYELEHSLDWGATWEHKATLRVNTDTGIMKVTDVAKVLSPSCLRELLRRRPPQQLRHDPYQLRVVDNGTVTATVFGSQCAMWAAMSPAEKHKFQIQERVAVLLHPATKRCVGLQAAFQKTEYGIEESCDPSDLITALQITEATQVAAQLQVRTLEAQKPPAYVAFASGENNMGDKEVLATPKEKSAKKGEKGEKEEDNRSFLEKYWIYIAVFVGWTILQGVIQAKGDPAAPQGAAPAQ